MIASNFVEDDEERTIRMQPEILLNDSEAFVACALAGIGMIQAIGAGISRSISNEAAWLRYYRA